jgi:hypothetical protein
LIALCPACHQVKHIGFARKNGKLKNCILHLMEVNQISQRSAERLIQKAFFLYQKRSAVKWEVDISGILKLK